MQVKEPAITVFIPTYNCSRFIGEAINSIKNQTYQNWCMLIQDDCSTDNTYEIATQMTQGDIRIKVSKNEQNLGMMKNWNKGLKKINTKYFVKLDGDDFMEISALKYAYEIMEQDNEVGMVCSSFNIVNLNSEIKSVHKAEGFGNGKFSPLCLVSKGINIFSSGISQQGILLVRKSILDEFKYYREFFWGDQEFWFRGGVKYDYFFIKRPLYNYRIWSHNVTKSHDDYSNEYSRNKGYYDCRKAIFDHYLNFNKITNNEHNIYEKSIRYEWYKYLVHFYKNSKSRIDILHYLVRIFRLSPIKAFKYYLNR